MTAVEPLPCSASQPTISCQASDAGRPVNRPELTITSSTVCSTKALSSSSVASAPLGITTLTMGSPNFFANAKSRSSWAGTAMIAPVP